MGRHTKSYVGAIVRECVRRHQWRRAVTVLAQRATDTVGAQRQVVFALELEAPPPGLSPWRVEPRSREVVAAHFPNSGHDVAATNGECALLALDDSVAGFAVWKRPERIPSFYFELPADSAYLAFIYLSPLARGGRFAEAQRALCSHLCANGVRWLVLSTNDWNEPMLRTCARAHMLRLGVGRRTNSGSRRFTPARDLPWLATPAF